MISIAFITTSDALCLQVLQGFQLGHCLGQFNQVDVVATCLVQDLDTSHKIICKADLDGAICVGCGACYGKSFVI
jgi:hypothetical protein